VSNVVTYNAVVSVENNELKLRPGMTANVTFIVARRRNVLVVPNAALRFNPPEDALAHLGEAERALASPTRGRGGPSMRGGPGSGRPPADGAGPRAERPQAAGGGGPASAAKPAQGPGEATPPASDGQRNGDRGPGRPGRARRDPSQRVVWVMVEELPRPVQVKVGITDGTTTEIVSGDLAAGAMLITGMSGGKSGGSRPSGGRMRRGRFL
jgi:HlyD family secretion protein